MDNQNKPQGATPEELIARFRSQQASKPKLRRTTVVNPVSGDSEVMLDDPLNGLSDGALNQLDEIMSKVPPGQKPISLHEEPQQTEQIEHSLENNSGKKVKKVIYEDDTVEEIDQPKKRDLTKEFGF